MKTIEINNKTVKYYESFEEAANNSKDRENFEMWAEKYYTDFLKACEATGVVSLIWIEVPTSWAGVALSPYILVDGVAMDFRRTAGPKSNCYFFGLNVVYMLDGDKWRYDQPKPNNVGKPTAKTLKAWAKYIKEEHAAAIAHKNELQQQRAETREKNLKLLKDAGFIQSYRCGKSEEAREFTCTRGAVRCDVYLDFDNKIYKSYKIDYKTASELFSDIK